MSEKLKSGNFSFDTYITKQEGLLVDYLRKTLQAETKVAILESALQEMYKKVEELNQQIEMQQLTFDQSINGLQSVTVERDGLQSRLKEVETSHQTRSKEIEASHQREKESLLNRIKELEQALGNCNSEKSSIRNHANTQDNRVAVLQNEIKHLNNRVQIASDDYSTLKENYNRVLAAFEDANKKIEALEAANTQETVVATKQKKRSKKVQETDSEWVDGEYKIST